MGRRPIAIAVLVVILAALLGLNSFPANAAAPDWWNTAWTARHALSVNTNTSAVAAGHSVSFSFNHAAMVSAGQSMPSGSDVRIVHWNGSTWTELDRVLDPESTWNSQTTVLWFKLQTAIGSSSSASNYYLYFRNPAAGIAPSNGKNIFPVYDQFDGGVIDTGQWFVEANPGVSTTQVGGQLVIAGTAQNGSHFFPNGVRTEALIGNSYSARTRFSILKQSTTAQANWKANFGNNFNNLAIDSNGTNLKKARHYSTTASDWFDDGPTTMQGQTVPSTRVELRQTAAGAISILENGVQQGSRTGADVTPVKQFFDYSPDIYSASGDQSFDVRYDYAIIRQTVDVEPTVSLSAAEMQVTSGIELEATVAPVISMSVSGRSSVCNAVSPAPTSLSSATEVLLGSVSAGSSTVGAQSVSVASNAGNGFVVTVAATGPYSNGSSVIPPITATNANPDAMPALGIAYTTSSASLSGTAARFSAGGTKWAGLTTQADEIDRAVGPSVATNTCVAYQVATAASTPPGTYRTTVVYLVVPIF